MLSRALSLLPALRVHSWGGFGSQLFTAYVILKVQKRYPGRRIKVIVHTSGVTRRVSEFNFENLGVKSRQIEDYRETAYRNLLRKDSPRYRDNLKKTIRASLLRLLNWSSLIQSADSDESFASIRFWTFALRGHYSRLSLHQSLIYSLYQTLFSEKELLRSEDVRFAVHYRLGDLLNLAEKNPVSLQRIESVMLNAKFNPEITIVLSDSDESTLAPYLQQSRVLKQCKVGNFEPKITLWTCIQAPFFLGTTAKLSLWAAVFRHFILDKNSFMPSEFLWIGPSNLKITWY